MNDHSQNKLKSQFDEAAQQYDQQRKMLIPCFDDFYRISVSLAQSATSSPNLLDLGAGTGLFSSLMMQKYPDANLTLIDLSEKMLEIAKLRFKGSTSVTYIVDDYTNFISPEKYDIIISGLSIHHLTDADKQTLYKNTYSHLKPGGIFINADQVLGHTPFIQSLYTTDWKDKVEASQLSRQEIDAAYERTKLDKMSPLQTQINWLQEIGFSEVDCVYKYFNFVVLFARK
ncbi:class I SAM-dependent methyltransferase [Paenibacillus assamensis]|uniref:class I SAM-dependent methyltransferase n=1 Tax=Paenibacillus assamensis TaxID=311244 RepID=UPI0004249796|nr:class I SAM-dependent methyltransferase [Paenibacillus assamensis]